VNVHLNLRAIRIATLVVVLIGLLVIIYGGYTLLDGRNKYDEVSKVPTPTLEEIQKLQPGDPMITSLRAIQRDLDDARQRQGQGTSIIGVGAVLLGAAVVIMMRLPEQTS
jgi:hypothetical protein